MRADLLGTGRVAKQMDLPPDPGNTVNRPWRKRSICQRFPHALEAIAADFDSDGDIEVVAAAERGGNEVRWWRNEGT